MTYNADGTSTVAPKILIIPNITTTGLKTAYVSGMVAISGQSLMMWMGKWAYISGCSFRTMV